MLLLSNQRTLDHGRQIGDGIIFVRSNGRRSAAHIAAAIAVACLLVATIHATPSIAAPIFADGFESGDLSAWTGSVNFAVQSTSVHSGSWAGAARASGAASHATRAFATQTELWSTVWFKVDARTSAVWLTSFRKSNGGALVLVGLNKKGFLIARYSATKTTFTSTIKLTDTGWHQIRLHLKTGAGGGFDVALDTVPVAALTQSSDLGGSSIGQIKIGDTYTGRNYDVAFDDVSVATDAAVSDTTDPTQPMGLLATLESALSVRLTWEPSSDDTGVTGYSVLRSLDGTNFSEVGSSITTEFIDSGLQPQTTYWWTVEAFDAAGNRSLPSAPATATTGSDPGEPVGSWGQPFDVGVVGVNAAVLFTGKVLLYYEGDPSGTKAKLWDPATGSIKDVSTPVGDQHNLFCSGLSLRPNGDVFVSGGTLWGGSNPYGEDKTAFFNPITEAWRIGPPMAWSRWYPTNVTLPDGDTLVFSGSVSPGVNAQEVERYDGVTDAMSTLPSSATRDMELYPRMFVLGDGRIARVGREAETVYFDPATNLWSAGPTMLHGNRARGSAVLMPDGRTVLGVGGANDDITTNTAELVDLGASQPSWSFTGSMNEPRRSLNAVLLPDGKVLAVGGNRGTTNYDDPVFTAELYDPATGTWTLGPAQVAPRAYHSTAVLLPDGRVLSAGQTNGNMQTTAEIYSPPYLSAGPRPVITGAPANVGYGGTFSVDTDRAGDIADVVLIRPGTVTHGVFFDQRSVTLPFTPQTGSLSVDAPSSSTKAPPGWYMMFLVDNTGVPSIASWVQVS